MKRVWGHVIAGAVLLGGGAITSTACVHDNSTLFIRAVLAPQLVTNGQQCIYTSDPTQVTISGGVLDIDFSGGYTAEFLVGNQTVPVGNPATPNTETSRILIQGGIVRITDSNGKQLTSYTRYTAETVDPLQGMEPSYAPVSLTILDSATVAGAGVAGVVSQGTFGNRPEVRLVTYTRLYGYTLGGDYVESNEYEFPVDVCKGCLIQFAPQDIDPALPVPNCAGANSASTSLPIPCSPGQDFSIDCSQCQAIDDCRVNGGVGSGIADAGAG